MSDPRTAKLAPFKALALGVWQRRAGRAGVLVLGGWLLTAAAADLLASDKPLCARFQGRLYLLPCVSDPVELRPYNLESLAPELATGDWLLPTPVGWGPQEQDKGEMPLAPPSARHWLGTDTARRDVLARLVHGGRVAALVGLVSVSIYVLIGTLLGLIAAYFGGIVDLVVSRVTEAVMALPVFFLVLAVMGVVERAGIGTMMVVIGLVYWTRVARLVRAEAMRLRAMAFVEAAVALGFCRRRIMFLHILPGCAGPIVVTATFGAAAAILIEAGLSFLGFGASDEVASWGALLQGAMGHFDAWWLVLFPGLAIFATVTACNLCGEALQDALDPRLGGRRAQGTARPVAFEP